MLPYTDCEDSPPEKKRILCKREMNWRPKKLQHGLEIPFVFQWNISLKGQAVRWLVESGLDLLVRLSCPPHI